MEKVLLLISFLLVGITAFESKALELPSIFGNSMVMQQKTECPIWGKASSGEDIEITSSWGEKTIAKAKANGKWEAKLKTPEAGGPYKLTIKGKDSVITFENVLVGEVWVCSGQSNMEMPLMGWPPRDTIKNSAKEIKNANYSEIRLFTVAKGVSAEPREGCKGFWTECNPETAKNFSATAYFFGKEIHKELEIPVGLINTSWGGTPAESWTSPKYLSKVEGFSDFVANIDKLSLQEDEYNKWLGSHPVIESTNEDERGGKGVSFNDTICSFPDFDDSSWKEMTLPTLWESVELGVFDGVVWFRKAMNIPESWIGKDLMLELGPIDDIDITFFNGERVGGYEGMGFWTVERKYKIPSKLVKKGKNVIAVRVVDLQGGGGIYGEKAQMKIYPTKGKDVEPLNLSGLWKYLPVAQYREGDFYVFGVEENDFYTTKPAFKGIDQYTPTVLYNAMIAPIVPYGIKGTIYYQGESNVGRHEQYKHLFPAMIESWRAAWGLGKFPFYFVQIAPYMYDDPEDPVSAKLREAQMETMLSVPNTGMAVTMDIGEVDNIHPPNKQEVGKRLSLWALTKDYGKEDIVYSGPIFKEMVKKGSRITLYFDHIGSGLVAKGDTLTGFQVAGDDKVFVDAEAYINGNTVVVYSKEAYDPIAVRYAFTNGSEASLFNREGLPASSFRTDDWEE
ncbi:glycosyl hydrolase family 2 [candidate division WOR-3 bacterium]|nr:glycosyl hydrolase family 2 [candidate division WOR-3 bacterium]